MVTRAALLFSPYELFEYALSICGFGAVAQLGERLPRTEEAGGSNPLCSTKSPRNEGISGPNEGTCFDRSSTRSVLWNYSGRARRGVSGALNPKSALAGPKAQREGSLLQRALSGYAVKAGSRGVRSHEPRQVRKEAAVRGASRCRGVAWLELNLRVSHCENRLEVWGTAGKVLVFEQYGIKTELIRGPCTQVQAQYF